MDVQGVRFWVFLSKIVRNGKGTLFEIGLLGCDELLRGVADSTSRQLPKAWCSHRRSSSQSCDLDLKCM